MHLLIWDINHGSIVCMSPSVGSDTDCRLVVCWVWVGFGSVGRTVDGAVFCVTVRSESRVPCTKFLLSILMKLWHQMSHDLIVSLRCHPSFYRVHELIYRLWELGACVRLGSGWVRSCRPLIRWRSVQFCVDSSGCGVEFLSSISFNLRHRIEPRPTIGLSH